MSNFGIVILSVGMTVKKPCVILSVNSTFLTFNLAVFLKGWQNWMIFIPTAFLSQCDEHFFPVQIPSCVTLIYCFNCLVYISRRDGVLQLDTNCKTKFGRWNIFCAIWKSSFVFFEFLTVSVKNFESLTSFIAILKSFQLPNNLIALHSS